MEYEVEIYRNGITQAPGPEMFFLSDWDQEYTLYTYVFVVKNDEHLMFVDTGCGDISIINDMLYEAFKGKISFDLPEDETIHAIIDKAHVDPEKVDYVFVSHLHHDHSSNIELFPNAKVVLSKKGLLEYMKKERPYYYNDALFPPKPIQYIAAQPADKLILVEDEMEILPGITCFWVGGHTPGCMAVEVNTEKGNAIFTSDIAFLERNVKAEHPIGLFYNLWECHEAYKKFNRRADIILTSHDPDILLKKFPDGKI
jgi:glyoxylase-like metal-dependent hydrolase (beta-lactamase superfamily II)